MFANVWLNSSSRYTRQGKAEARLYERSHVASVVFIVEAFVMTCATVTDACNFFFRLTSLGDSTPRPKTDVEEIYS